MVLIILREGLFVIVCIWGWLGVHEFKFHHVTLVGFPSCGPFDQFDALY